MRRRLYYLVPDAPSARRTPISRLRVVTLCHRTPESPRIAQFTHA